MRLIFLWLGDSLETIVWRQQLNGGTSDHINIQKSNLISDAVWGAPERERSKQSRNPMGSYYNWMFLVQDGGDLTLTELLSDQPATVTILSSQSSTA
jgi:hypothetical protein